jgi:copper chaperone CopZ
MRLVIVLLAVGLPAAAQFQQMEVTFEDTGCASCVESLEGRLARVRGVEAVDLDAERGVVTLRLEENNRVRLGPLFARITQDGTKITRVAAVAHGAIEGSPDTWVFHPSGLGQTFRLQLTGEAAKIRPEGGAVYKVSGVLSGTEFGEGSVFEAAAIVQVK